MKDPWRMLMTLSTPHTREKRGGLGRRDAAAAGAPTSRRSLHADAEVALLDGNRVDDDRLAALDLEDRRLQGHDLPRGSEPHRPEERRRGGTGQGVTHLPGVPR